MISSYLTMQNAILSRNMCVSRMMQTSNMLMSSISFGNCRSDIPSFSQANYDELKLKSDETRVSVLKKLIDSINKRLGNEIKKSTPKYSGVDYKA